MDKNTSECISGDLLDLIYKGYELITFKRHVWYLKQEYYECSYGWNT